MMHNAVEEEFGERHSDPSLGASVSEKIEDQENPELATDAVIDLHEFPWATGDIGDIGAAVPVGSGEPQLPLHTRR